MAKNSNSAPKTNAKAKTTTNSNAKNTKALANSLSEDLHKIKWGKWKGKDGIFHNFLKVLLFSTALLLFFALGNLVISLVWGLF